MNMLNSPELNCDKFINSFSSDISKAISFQRVMFKLVTAYFLKIDETIGNHTPFVVRYISKRKPYIVTAYFYGLIKIFMGFYRFGQL